MEKFEDFLQKTCDTTQAKKTTDFVAVSWHFLTEKKGFVHSYATGKRKVTDE